MGLDCYFDSEKNQLEVLHNAGFFALCSATLWALTSLYPAEKYVKVNWPGQDVWRDKEQAGMNLFDMYFHPNAALDPHSLSSCPAGDPHGIYKRLRFDKLNPYVQNYFALSDIVRTKKEELISKYKIDFDNTIALCYRGTSKWLEIAPVPPPYYIEEARRLLARNHKLRVLVQTDQLQVREIYLLRLGDRAFTIDEMPVTPWMDSLHTISESQRGISNFEFGVRLLAVVSILSKCKFVITHTGSVGLWTCLFRGNARNTCQLRPIQPPDIISNYDYEIWPRRVFRRSMARFQRWTKS